LVRADRHPLDPDIPSTEPKTTIKIKFKADKPGKENENTVKTLQLPHPLALLGG
jgi:hypothetical protein